MIRENYRSIDLHPIDRSSNDRDAVRLIARRRENVQQRGRSQVS
jgi:hypothetical protein